LIPWLLLSLGALLGFLLAPAGSAKYLDLQAASDGVHRNAIIALPAGALIALIFLSISIIARRRNRVRFISRTVMGCVLGVTLGALVFITQFDSQIEQKGLTGQLVQYHAPQKELRWNPSTRLVDGDMQYFLGPGYRYEDNVAIAAVNRSSGRLRWTFHCLGNAVSDASIQGGRLSFKTWRPSVTASYVLDLHEPRVLSFAKE
jgi:hypothetical protein